MKISELPWWKDRILEDGRLSDLDTQSEYERGFIDCWNELWRKNGLKTAV